MPHSAPSPSRAALALKLAALGREFHSRRWALGTSGNYSALLRRQPVRLLITSSGLDKSALRANDFLQIDQQGRVVRGKGKPSAETFLHLAVVRARNAGCVLHTHSIWSTLLPERREWIPIFANDQDIPALARKVEAELGRDPASHGFLLSGHGLYTWGEDVAEARRHVEIFEFLFEVAGRREFGPPNA